MSLLFKRPTSPYWYVTKTRQSTKTVNRKLAEEFARKTLTELWRRQTLREELHTWRDLMAHWLDRKGDRPSAAQDEMVIARFSEFLRELDITNLNAVSGQVVSDYARAVKAAASASTANRHLNTIRAMLRRAYRQGWIASAPVIEPYQVTKVEVNWLTLDQFNTIIPHLPVWVADMAVFAVQTGLRFSNVAGMRWEWLSADGNTVVVPAIQTKTRKTYVVPLSSVAKALLSRLEASRGASAYVFIGRRRLADRKVYEDYAPVSSIRNWWEPACKKAGLPGTRWHDLRHTWASLHVIGGTPDRILAAMGGWTTPRMLENYAHLLTSHLLPYADNINKDKS